MARVPLIGRLHLREYLALNASLLLIFLEVIIRIIILTLPSPVIAFCYHGSRKIFNYLSSPHGRKSRSKMKVVVNSIAQATNFVELCELFGYVAEEHIVQTQDGYLLGLHRLGLKKNNESPGFMDDNGDFKKKVVYLHHGLMMNSEVWVCTTEKKRSLPFLLVDSGYDVWLGNNRGNKYSKKCVNKTPTQISFWNFSIDQFAFHDIPDSINYILSTTNQRSLSYIGFSQGTAQAFATLSINPGLNDKVDIFIGLAPAMSPKGLTSGIVDSMVKASPELLFLAFGRRAMLESAIMWQAILYPPIFIRLIDLSLAFLFGWKCQNISVHQKLAAYPHLYSFTSTKSVVHWFQIIRTGTFQMYDDEVQAPFYLSNSGKYYKVAKFPTRNIRTPIHLFYGGSDSLVDIAVMLKELPIHTQATKIPHYEHLDFLWASDTDKQVIPQVFVVLESIHNKGRQTRPFYTQHFAPRSHLLTKLLPNSSLATQRGSIPDMCNGCSSKMSNEVSQNFVSHFNSNIVNHQTNPTMTTARPCSSSYDFFPDHLSSPTQILSATPRSLFRSNGTCDELSTVLKRSKSTPAASVSHATAENSEKSCPENWWSSDEAAEPGTEDDPNPSAPKRVLYELHAADGSSINSISDGKSEGNGDGNF